MSLEVRCERGLANVRCVGSWSSSPGVAGRSGSLWEHLVVEEVFPGALSLRRFQRQIRVGAIRATDFSWQPEGTVNRCLLVERRYPRTRSGIE